MTWAELTWSSEIVVRPGPSCKNLFLNATTTSWKSCTYAQQRRTISIPQHGNLPVVSYSLQHTCCFVVWLNCFLVSSRLASTRSASSTRCFHLPAILDASSSSALNSSTSDVVAYKSRVRKRSSSSEYSSSTFMPDILTTLTTLRTPCQESSKHKNQALHMAPSHSM